MHKSNKFAFVNLGQLVLDFLFLLVAYLLSYFITQFFTNLYSIHKYMWALIVFIPLWVLVMGSLGMYNRTTFNYFDRIVRNLLFASVVSSASLASLMFFIKETMFSRSLYGVFVVVSTILLLIERYLYQNLINYKFIEWEKKVIIVGVPDVAMKFLYYIRKTNIRMDILGYVQVDDNAPFKSRKKLGRIEDLEYILKERVVDEVIFTLPKDYVGEVEKYVLLCEKMGITVQMLLEMYDLKIAKTNLSSIGTLPMLTFHSVSLNRFQLFIKRSVDIVGALVGVTITGIVSIFVIPAIKFNSPGPILFKQDRVGRNGRIFKLYKFRSMYIDAEERKKELQSQNQVSGGLMFKIKNDPRITKIGAFLRKTSLDELPQFINVLKGDMSLVGTRPPTVDEVAKYKNHHFRRISIRPGLTGLWQVSGRSSITDFDEVVKLDTQYIDEWSIWLDFKLILKTFKVIFARKGAY